MNARGATNRRRERDVKREIICLSLWFTPVIHAQGIHDRAHDLTPLQVIWQPWLRGVERARRGSEAHGPKVLATLVASALSVD